MNRMIFAANLIYKRHQLKMTTKEMAEALGIQLRRYEQWEEGLCYPRMGMLIKLCDYLGDRDIYKLITTPIR